MLLQFQQQISIGRSFEPFGWRLSPKKVVFERQIQQLETSINSIESARSLGLDWWAIKLFRAPVDWITWWNTLETHYFEGEAQKKAWKWQDGECYLGIQYGIWRKMRPHGWPKAYWRSGLARSGALIETVGAACALRRVPLHPNLRESSQKARKGFLSKD